jgi:excinuclease UvrABC nuclease subunit
LFSHSISFSADHAADFFAQFPLAPAVFLLRGAEASAEPYVAKTASLRRRLQRLLAPPAPQSKRLNLRDRVAAIEYTLTGSDFESVVLLYRALRQEFPKAYQKRLRLRPSPLVRLNLENPYPRAYVTTRMGRLGAKSIYYGPFRSRALAEKFLNDSLDQFKMRRCTFDLHPDPEFPGCIYSEMKMCLAPCFQGCTDPAYSAEVERVQAYLDSGGQSLIAEMEAERERLSGALDFEAAAQQHAKIAKIKGILSGCDEICGRLDRLDAVIIQPASRAETAAAKSVALFRFRFGELAGPHPFSVESETESQSLEQRLREALREFQPAGARSAVQFMEELAILKRWYYRSHKIGATIIANTEGELSARKIANAAGRVLRGERGMLTPLEQGEPHLAQPSSLDTGETGR